MSPEMGQAIEGHLDRLDETMAPGPPSGAYFNFAERPGDLEAIFDAETCDRLARSSDEWDPDGLIRANHAFAVAAG